MLVVSNYYCSNDYVLEEGIIGDFVSDKWNTLKKNVRKILNSAPNKVKEIEQRLIKNGIDIQKIRKYAEQEAKKSKFSNGKLSGFQGKLNEFVQKFFAHQFSSDEMVDGAAKLGISLAILAAVLFILNFFITTLLGFGIAKQTVYHIVVIFLTPLIEETGKMISIKCNATGLYFLVFNAYEFTKWVRDLVGIGVPLSTAIILRSISVILHYVLTMIHVHYQEKGETGTGWSLAVILHMLWNTLCSMKSLTNS